MPRGALMPRLWRTKRLNEERGAIRAPDQGTPDVEEGAAVTAHQRQPPGLFA
jgi:hypothetical protein